MNWRSDLLWIVAMSAAILAVVLGGSWIWNKYSPKNDQLVLKQFVYRRLSECTEKLGAYGEKVEFNIKYSEATFKNLDVCLEKLGAYGEKVTRRGPLQ